MQSTSNKAERHHCIFGCFGAVYVGAEVTKEWIKGFPGLIKEMFNYIPSMAHCMSKNSKHVCSEIKDITSPAIQSIAHTTQEISNVTLAGAKKSFKYLAKIENTCENIGKEVGEIIKIEGKESYSYGSSSMNVIKKQGNKAGTAIIRAFRPSSTIKVTATHLTKEYIDYIQSSLKQPIHVYKALPRSEINHVIKENIPPLILEPFSYGIAAGKDIVKTGDKSFQEVSFIALLAKEKLVVHLWNETKTYFHSSFKTGQKEIVNATLFTKDFYSEIFKDCINQTLLEISRFSLMFGKQFARHVMEICMAMINSIRIISRCSLFIACECLSYIPPAYLQSKKSLKLMGEYVLNLKDLKVILKCFQESLTYVKPSFQVLNKSSATICDHAAEIFKDISPACIEIMTEMTDYLTSASKKSFKQIVLVSLFIKEGIQPSKKILIEMGKEYLSYITSGSHQMEMTVQTILNNPEKDRLLEQIGWSLLEVMSFLKATSKTTNVKTKSLKTTTIEISNPITKYGSHFTKEELSYFAAGFGEIRKLSKILEEDFPSSFQHFIVDPSHFWILRTHRNYQEAKARFKIRLNEFKENFVRSKQNNFRH
ncbi:MAG: hypothetical protein Q8K60_04320 [Parachlamydiaceae bacterium]|nr:hypothetical protein [Parachlamydiaceae bacterium]